MTDKYEQFKEWFLKKEFKIKRDVHWFDPQVIFRYFEIEQEETQTLDQLQKICNKYDIPFNDLPEVLEEYIATDNEEYLEKIRRQKTYE